MTVGVILFVGYLGLQLLRFAKPPTLAVSDPPQAVLEVDADETTYLLKGTSIPGATITVEVPGQPQPYRVSADGAGRWSVEVDLRRGRNQFDITALDPETGKTAETPARIFITVPFLETVTPAIRLDSPPDGGRFENGAIPIQGIATNAERVTVTAEWLGPADNQPVASGAPTPVAPAPVAVEVAGDGSFDVPFELTAGQWRITATASNDGSPGKSSVQSTVTVAYEGVNLSVQVKGGSAWLKVWVDGKLEPTIGAGGLTVRSGRTLTFTAKESIEVRTGSSGNTYFTLNGTNLGALGRRGIPETWLFEPPNEPVQTDRR